VKIHVKEKRISRDIREEKKVKNERKSKATNGGWKKENKNNKILRRVYLAYNFVT
jgi:hypothetical protein